MLYDLNKQDVKAGASGTTSSALVTYGYIIYQMKKCVCKININGINGTGFFTKIPCCNESIKVLITNNHIINEKE